MITTLTPSTDECVGGISSNLLDFSALNGSALSYSVLDVNSDGKIDASDKVTGTNDKLLVVSGVPSKATSVRRSFWGAAGVAEVAEVATT
ncbi:hypothetical protein AWV80_20505 [Cupriavidus sp. UYMU48A]|nr:hypothetical protein AWV80_20505 [Cupriavidus sp. UYMU48A]